MIRVAVCDDDNIFLNRMNEYLNKFTNDSDNGIIFKLFLNGHDLLEEAHNYDLFLLDVEMPEINGINLAKRIRSIGIDSDIVFLTSVKEKGYKAFEVNAKNYLIKPISYIKIRDVLIHSINGFHDKKKNIIVFKQEHNKVRHVLYTELVFVEAKGRKCIVNCDNETFEVNEKFSDVVKKVVSLDFTSPHRSYLINLWKVNDYNNREIRMKNGMIVPISRLKVKDFTRNYFDFISYDLDLGEQ